MEISDYQIKNFGSRNRSVVPKNDPNQDKILSKI